MIIFGCALNCQVGITGLLKASHPATRLDGNYEKVRSL